MSPHEKIIFHFGNAKDPKTRQKVVPPNPLILLLEENRLLLEEHQEWTGQLSQLLPVGKAVRLGVQVSGNGFFRTMLRLPLHSSPACRHSLDFAHVAMVYGGHLTIVPGNRDRVPTYFGDTAAIIGIALPVNAAALLETLRFRDRHAAPPIACHRVHITYYDKQLVAVPLCPIETSTDAGRIRRRTLTLRPLRRVLPATILSPRPECIERQRGLCRLLRKPANKGAGNSVPSRPPSPAPRTPSAPSPVQLA